MLVVRLCVSGWCPIVVERNVHQFAVVRLIWCRRSRLCKELGLLIRFWSGVWVGGPWINFPLTLIWCLSGRGTIRCFECCDKIELLGSNFEVLRIVCHWVTINCCILMLLSWDWVFWVESFVSHWWLIDCWISLLFDQILRLKGMGK